MAKTLKLTPAEKDSALWLKLHEHYAAKLGRA